MRYTMSSIRLYVVISVSFMSGLSQAQISEHTALSVQNGYQRQIIRPKAGMFGILSQFYRVVFYRISNLDAVHENIVNPESHSYIPTCAGVTDDGLYMGTGDDGPNIYIESIRDERVVDTLSIAPRKWGQCAMHLFDRKNMLVICEDLARQRQVLVRIIDGQLRYTCNLPQFSDRNLDVNFGVVGITDSYNTVLFSRIPETDSLELFGKFNYIGEPTITQVAILDDTRAALQYGYQRTDVIDMRTGAVLHRFNASSFSYDRDSRLLFVLDGRQAVARDLAMKELWRARVDWDNAVEIFADASGIAYGLVDGTIVGAEGRVRNLPFGAVLDFYARGDRSVFRSKDEACYTAPGLIVRHRLALMGSVTMGRESYAYSTSDTVFWYLSPHDALVQLRASAHVAAMGIFADSVLYLATVDGAIYRLTAARHDPVFITNTGNSQRALRVDVSPDERYLIITHTHGHDFVEVQNKTTKTRTGYSSFLDTPGKTGSLLPSGDFAWIFDTETQKRVSEFYTNRTLLLAAVSGSGAFIPLYTRDSTLVMFDLHTGGVLYEARRYVYPNRLWAHGKSVYIHTLNQVIHSYTRTESTVVDGIADATISVYPNPSKGLIYLNNMHPATVVRVFDLLGRLVLETAPGVGHLELDRAGVYQVVQYSMNGVSIHRAQVVVTQ